MYCYVVKVVCSRHVVLGVSEVGNEVTHLRSQCAGLMTLKPPLAPKARHEVGGRSAPGLDDDASVILQYGFEGLRYTISPTREYVALSSMARTAQS